MQMNTLKKNNGIKYLVFVATDKNKISLRNYQKLWKETKSQIEAIIDGNEDDEPIRYRKDLRKIRFESYDDLPFG